MPITLVVASPSALTSEVMSRAFNQRRKQFKVLGCTYTCKDLLKHVADHHPDVALVDARLESDATAGLWALRELRAAQSATRAIMLVDCSEPEQVIQAFSHGARGVICKTEPFEVLCKCIRCVHDGQVWADSSQLQWIVQALSERQPVHIVSATGAPLLSKREEQIVRMVVDGMTNAEIRSQLGVSAHTVKNHLYHIYNKLGISNRAELLLYAFASRGSRRGRDDPAK